MTIKTLLTNMTSNEDNLFIKQFKKKKHIQLFATNGLESGAFIQEEPLNPFNLVIGITSNQGKTCAGRYGNAHFLFPSGSSSGLTRVWIDCTEQSDIRFHVNCSGEYYELSNEDEERDVRVVVLLHCPDFVQLSFYDGRLPDQKVCHFFTIADHAAEKIRTIGLSMLNQQFPGLAQHLLQLEGECYGGR